PHQALRRVEDGLALAERLGHPFSLDFAHLATAMVRLFRWEIEPALVHLEHAAAISGEEGFAYQRAVCATLEGWARVLQGRPDDAIARLRDGLAGYAATGTAVARPASTALPAHATAMRGRVPEGLELVAEGMADAERTNQRFHLVQLHLTRGDLLLWGAEPQPAEAEACYRRALDLARSFDALFHQLRAATNLARL